MELTKLEKIPILKNFLGTKIRNSSWKYDFLEFLGSEKKFGIFSVANP